MAGERQANCQQRAVPLPQGRFDFVIDTFGCGISSDIVIGQVTLALV